MPRTSALLAASLATAVLASCSTKSEACATPTGCIRSENVAGSCQCLEWEIVSIEPVPIKYMVVGIVYALPGNVTGATYGSYAGGDIGPVAASEFGMRFRSVVSEPDGAETVAALGPNDVRRGDVGFDLTPVTKTSGALVFGTGCVPPACAAALGVNNSYDVPSHEDDTFYLWVNPGAAVTTDYSGRKAVAWSIYSSFPGPGFAPPPFMDVMPISARQLHGTLPLPSGVLPPLDPSDVASILSHDPFFASTPITSGTLQADPRYRFLGTAAAGGAISSTPPTSWACSSAVTDDDFPVLDAASVPFGTRETLLLQATSVGVVPSCTVQRPGLSLATSTPGCSFQADVFVDTVFGTLLTVQTSADPACTAAP